MFGLSAFDAVKDGAVKDTLNFDEFLDDSADETLGALEGALCCDGKEGCCDVDDSDFEDEYDPEDAEDYFPGEPISDIDDDDDPEEFEDEDYDDIVDGTDVDGFVEGFDDDDDPEEFEDDELGEFSTKKKKKCSCKKCANESAFDDLFADDDIATEGSAFEPKMDPNSFTDTYFRDTIDIETDSDRSLLMFDEEDDDEDDMGVELGLESVLASAAASAVAFTVGSALGIGTVLGIEKISSAINEGKLKRKGANMRTPTEDELREFYSAALKASAAVAKCASSIASDHDMPQNSIRYFEPKEKTILKRMRKCKGALGICIAAVAIPNGMAYSHTIERNFLTAVEDVKKKVAAAVPAGIETYNENGCIIIYMALD